MVQRTRVADVICMSIGVGRLGQTLCFFCFFFVFFFFFSGKNQNISTTGLPVSGKIREKVFYLESQGISIFLSRVKGSQGK